MSNKPNLKILDDILERTVKSLEQGQEEIFDIAESTRAEAERARQELEKVKAETADIIRQVDQMETRNKKARMRLLHVSREFEYYSEDEIKEAYEKAEDSLVKLSILREKEENLRQKRDEYERRLINMEKTVDKAENLVSQVGVAVNYLLGSLKDIGTTVEDLQHKSQLGIRIIQAQEEERKRVARDIHDGPAQSIANVVFRSEYVESLMDKDLAKAKEEINELKSQVRLTLQDIRKIIFDLRPMTLDDLGLIPTLRRYTDKFYEKSQVRTELIVIGNEKKLNPSLKVTIFRIIQEALNNVHKHAQTKRAMVKIEYQPSHLNLVVEDKGKGFNLEKVKEMTEENESYGLLSLEERAELVGGKMKIITSPGKGTKIRIKMPFAKEGVI